MDQKLNHAVIDRTLLRRTPGPGDAVRARDLLMPFGVHLREVAPRREGASPYLKIRSKFDLVGLGNSFEDGVVGSDGYVISLALTVGVRRTDVTCIVSGRPMSNVILHAIVP